MGAFGISLLFSIGAGAWLFNKSQRRNGGLTQQSFIASGVGALVIFIVLFTLLLTILP